MFAALSWDRPRRPEFLRIQLRAHSDPGQPAASPDAPRYGAC